jgi:hypothetical protein
MCIYDDMIVVPVVVCCCFLLHNLISSSFTFFLIVCCRNNNILFVVVVGPVEHVRTSGETLSWSAFVRRSWFGRVLGARRRLCPIYAKRQRYGPDYSYYRQSGWYWSLCLASHIRCTHFAEGDRIDQMAVKKRKRPITTHTLALVVETTKQKKKKKHQTEKSINTYMMMAR